MKHKHYEMIVAKAANTELVVFIKYVDGWGEASFLDLVTLDNPFFLCLPQHKEACLHWLNGGEVQNNITKHLRDDSWINFTPFNSSSCEPWAYNCNFMREESNFSIKPRKEKRWIAIAKNFQDSNSPRVVDPHLFKSKEDAIEFHGSDGYQFIEIEVEV